MAGRVVSLGDPHFGRCAISELEIRTETMAHGGSAIARRDGKAYFVDGAIPGELITGVIEVDKASWGRIRLVDILEQSPGRTDPACRHFGRCGGCQWLHVDYEPHLEEFYQGCGFRPTLAGLMHLNDGSAIGKDSSV